MAERKKYVGDAAIGRAIKSLGGKIEGLNQTVQDIAVSIVVHAAGPGNGDVSRALDLCKTVQRHRTLNLAFLVGWFRHFGNCNVNVNADDGKGKVSLISKDSRAYRGFDPAGAEHNNWYDAYDPNTGKKAPWYQGPPPPEFKPATIGDLAEDFRRFVKRERDKLNGTKEVNGNVIPLVVISEADAKQLDSAFDFIERIANTLARHEDMEQAAKALAEAQEAAEADEEVVAIMQPKEKAVA